MKTRSHSHIIMMVVDDSNDESGIAGFSDVL